MHNIFTIYSFEVARTLKKKSFWFMALFFPLLISALIAVVFFSNKTTSELADNLAKPSFSFEITDKSGLVSEELLAQFKGSYSDDPSSAIQRVKTGELAAYFIYPQDPTKDPVTIHAQDSGVFENGKYDAIAKGVLKQSALQKTTPTIAYILANPTPSQTTIYKEGEVYNVIQQMILPGLFLVLFYMLISFFGNQMLTSTTEEKENRVIEMLLTTVNARSIIIGKILALVTLAIMQIIIILLPVIVAFVFFQDSLALPAINLNELPVDWARIGAGALIFSLSFTLFTGILVAVGAAMPTAKEAGSVFGIVMLFMFGPLYAVTLFISSPESPIVQFLSLFPFTSPIPLMLRNAVGNLSALDYILGLSILFVSASAAIYLAVQLFKRGAIEYSKKISLKNLFNR